LLLVAKSAVGLKAPLESNTTSLLPPGFRESNVFSPEPTPAPVTFISSALYPPPATVESTKSITCPLLTCPLPAFAVNSCLIRVPEVSALSRTVKMFPVASVELIKNVPSFCW